MREENEPLEILDGRFRLDSEMTAGGMGTVYRGVDLTTNEPVAVKISSSFGTQLGERFEQEANCLAEIAHPAIVRYVGHGRNSRREHYLAMEWLEGETLEDRLSQGALHLQDAFRVTRRIAEALQAVHSRGIIHRDIKPANIFLPNKDLSKLKLLDFGIARRLFDSPTMRLTQVGSTIGTPMYMSPEQAQGLPDLDGRADIFSLGCVVFECLMGHPPYMGDSTTATLLEIEQGHSGNVAGRLRSVSPKLGELVDRMLAKDRKDRPATMSEVIASLDKVAHDLRSTGALPVVRETSSARPSLGATAEQRLAVVLTIVPNGETQPAMASARFGGTGDIGGLLCRGFAGGSMSDLECAAMNPRLGPLGANLRKRPDGGYVVIFISDRPMPPGDLLANGALSALRLKATQPSWSFALAMGQVSRDDASRTEALCKDGRRLLSAPKPGAIYLPVDLRRSAETRFEVASDADGRCRVLFEKSLRDAPPTVLGKDIPCVGRDREISGLEALFTECLEESTPQVMLVAGVAGAGKSRVAREFLERIQHRGDPFALLVGRGDSIRMDVSLGLVGQALRAAAGIATAMPEATQRKRLHAHVSRHLPAEKADLFTAFLGEIAGIPFPDEHLPQLREARRDPRQMADQTQAYWVDWLEIESAHAPVVILFEDLHWGDHPSVAYVDAALRVLRDKPLFVLALGRPEMETRFPGLWRDRHPQRASLVPLGERAMETIIRAVLGEVPADKRAWLKDRAQGNPFFLEELLRSYDANPSLTDIPDTLVGMVQARFDAVGEECKGLLRAGALFGQTFQASGVKYMAPDMDPDDVDRWLEILAQREILFSRAPGKDCEYNFRHALHRDAAYALLGRDLKVVGHRLAGEFLESQPNPEAILVADHFERGHENQKAVAWLRLAANQALEVDDLPSALARVEKGVRLGADGEELAELRIVESDVRLWLGEYVEAERLARQARQCLDPTLRLRALYSLISAMGPQAKYDEIRAFLGELEPRPDQAELVTYWQLCTFGITAFLSSAGDFALARSVLSRMEREADTLSPYLLGRMELLRANVARIDGRLVESLNHNQRASELFQEIGNMREATLTLGNLGNSYGELGLLKEAEDALRRVLAIAVKRDLKYLLGGVYQLLCNVMAYQGRLAEAREAGLRSAAISQEQADYRFQGYAFLYLSITEFLAADFVQAEFFARQAVPLFDGGASVQPFAIALVARALLGQGRIAEAKDNATIAFQKLESLGGLDDGEIYVRIAYIETLLISGDELFARSALEKTLRVVQTKVATIEKLDWKRSFLHNLPENKRLFELAQQVGINLGADW